MYGTAEAAEPSHAVQPHEMFNFESGVEAQAWMAARLLISRSIERTIVRREKCET
jgi:hypothetical protein